ncbi:MAG: MogA/MoaB family molybdenum cofactor biosynthesis protein [Chloroflexi bacterium]|nr:MAG: MogA/MoaB family molybdenum cofactor biosynthesis protein [Chloroflexota bacterium]
MGAEEHRQKADRVQAGFAIITVSDTRTPETDENHHYLRERLERDGHHIVLYRIVRDEPQEIEAMLQDLATLPEVQIALFNGGTGISPRDRTYDVIARHLEKTIPGFGELFRMLSYEEIGAAAMLSRATGGLYQGKLVFSMPGSNHAVRMAMEKLILPELNHLIWEISRQR